MKCQPLDVQAPLQAAHGAADESQRWGLGQGFNKLEPRIFLPAHNPVHQIVEASSSMTWMEQVSDQVSNHKRTIELQFPGWQNRG